MAYTYVMYHYSVCVLGLSLCKVTEIEQTMDKVQKLYGIFCGGGERGLNIIPLYLFNQ